MALGVALASALVWSGAGGLFFEAYGGAALSVLLGAFLFYVARGAQRSREQLLASPRPPDP